MSRRNVYMEWHATGIFRDDLNKFSYDDKLKMALTFERVCKMNLDMSDVDVIYNNTLSMIIPTFYRYMKDNLNDEFSDDFILMFISKLSEFVKNYDDFIGKINTHTSIDVESEIIVSFTDKFKLIKASRDRLIKSVGNELKRQHGN